MSRDLDQTQIVSLYIFRISSTIIISFTLALPFLPAGFPLGFPSVPIVVFCSQSTTSQVSTPYTAGMRPRGHISFLIYCSINSWARTPILYTDSPSYLTLVKSSPHFVSQGHLHPLISVVSSQPQPKPPPLKRMNGRQHLPSRSPPPQCTATTTFPAASTPTTRLSPPALDPNTQLYGHQV